MYFPKTSTGSQCAASSSLDHGPGAEVVDLLVHVAETGVREAALVVGHDVDAEVEVGHEDPGDLGHLAKLLPLARDVLGVDEGAVVAREVLVDAGQFVDDADGEDNGKAIFWPRVMASRCAYRSHRAGYGR